MISPPSAYPLLTSRLAISPLSEPDAPAFVSYRQHPDIARWQGWETSYSASDAEQLIAAQPLADLPASGGWIQLAVRARSSGPLLGDVAIHRLEGLPDTFEIGVTLAPESQHRGIGREAVTCVVDYLFTRNGAHRVIATCDSRNEAVARLLRAVGLRRESRQRDIEFFKNEWISLDGYAMLASEHLSAGHPPG